MSETISIAHRTLAERASVTAASVAALADGWGNSLFPSGYVGGDGTFYAGLCYRCDFDATQEYGIGDLRKQLTGDNPRNFTVTGPAAARNVATFNDVNGLVLSTWTLPARTFQWGDPLGRYGGTQTYATQYTTGLGWRSRHGGDALYSMNAGQLKALAREAGITPLPRTKEQLRAALESNPAVHATLEKPHVWPAYFDGTTMVLRADSGVTADLLAGVVDAAVNGALQIGSGSGPFVTGLFLGDARDETPALIEERERMFDWYDARMAELAPVRAELEQRGHRFYFLGKPSERDGTVTFWLNGTGSPQPYGWYTLDELRAEKFVTDAAARR